jgi:hypothetical protein
MRRQLLCATVLLFWPWAGRTLRAEDDRWKDFRFLIGNWVSEAKPGAGTGKFTLEPGLEGKVLVRRNFADLPAAKGRPAEKHEDLMVIYPESSRQFRADYYDSEGHVIHYSVAPTDSGLVFTSPASAGPRFRLTYTRAENSTVRVKFEIAPPGKASQFRTYLEGTVRRQTSRE